MGFPRLHQILVTLCWITPMNVHPLMPCRVGISLLTLRLSPMALLKTFVPDMSVSDVFDACQFSIIILPSKIILLLSLNLAINACTGHFIQKALLWWWSYTIIEIGLTHWGRVTHICVSKLTIIGSDNGLSPGQRQAIIWTNAGIWLIRPLETNFSEILIKIHTFSFTKIHLKMSSGK